VKPTNQKRKVGGPVLDGESKRGVKKGGGRPVDGEGGVGGGVGASGL